MTVSLGHSTTRVSPNAQIGAGGADQRLGLRQHEIVLLSKRWRRRREVGGKSLALIAIVHRETFQKRDRLRLVAGCLGARALAVGYEAVGIDDGGAFFA